MPQVFSRKTLAFLRALKRNNDREWFRSRRPDYEQHVRGPMVALLARLAVDLRRFAPELISEPRVSLYRIFRDTRFSANKAPLKTNVAAHFPARGLPRNEGAGLYLEVTPTWVWIGGGLYMPSGAELRAIRAHIAENHRALHRVATGASFRRAVGTLEGERLATMPRGFVKDHPAAEYLRLKQFLAGREFEAEFALSPRFYPELLRIFRAVAPLVRYLNAGILAAPQPATLAEAPSRVSGSGGSAWGPASLARTPSRAAGSGAFPATPFPLAPRGAPRRDRMPGERRQAAGGSTW